MGEERGSVQGDMIPWNKSDSQRGRGGGGGGIFESIIVIKLFEQEVSVSAAQ